MLARATHKTYMKVLKVAVRVIPIPRPTLFTGANSSDALCDAIGLMGLGKLLIVTDKLLVEVGIVDKVEQSLVQAGVQFVRFDGVQSDPTYVQAEEGLQRYLKENCEGVLAIGGGSPIDCAKVIAARVTNRKSIKRLAGLLKVWQTPVPLFAIPTTAGTGSEVTVAAVISEPKYHQKTPLMDPKLVPLMAALDPTLMTELPPVITAATGLDALTHAVEAYISTNATKETDAYATAALRLIDANIVAAYKDGKSLKVRLNMAMASYYAGLAFTKASLGYAHAVAHQLGANYGTPHGVANALALPLVLKTSLPSAKTRMAKLSLLLNCGDADWDEPTNANALIEYIETLKGVLGIAATLADIQLDDVPLMAKKALKETHWNYPVPHYLTQKQLEHIFVQLKGTT